MTFWSTDEQLCHLWLQTLRELLERLCMCVFRLVKGSCGRRRARI